MIELIVLTVGFITLSGIVAMVDAALLSVSRAETEAMVERNLWGAQQLRTAVTRITRAVVVVVIVTNTINILGPIIVGQSAVASYGTGAIGWITVVLAFGTIVFSEIIPKSLGAHYAPTIARYAALPILSIMYVLLPLVVLLDRFSGLFRRGKRRVGTEAQIRALTTLGRRAGHIEPDEGMLIHNTFVLNDRRAADVMTPLRYVVAIDAGMPLAEAAKRIEASGLSRFPVFGDSADDPRGVVLARDILLELAQGRGETDLDSLTREALVVPADQRCDHLLLQLRLRRTHIAIVEEDGKTVGVVTLEDILEELVGEIRDETDTLE